MSTDRSYVPFKIPSGRDLVSIINVIVLNESKCNIKLIIILYILLHIILLLIANSYTMDENEII